MKHHDQQVGKVIILAIALPVSIVGALVLFCCGYCCWRHGSGRDKDKKRKKVGLKGVEEGQGQGEELGRVGGEVEVVGAGNAHGEAAKEGGTTTVKGDGGSAVSAETLVEEAGAKAGRKKGRWGDPAVREMGWRFAV